MSREMLAAGVMVWLLGALVGWFVGWAARGEQNRTWHRRLASQLTDTRAQLEEALTKLEDTHVHYDAQRLSPPATPAVVHVHLSPAQLWAAHHPLTVDPTGDRPVLPGRGHQEPTDPWRHQ